MSNTANDSSGSTRLAAHNVVATYPSPDDARAALTMLERHGVEGADIELFGPGIDTGQAPVTNDEQREADLDTATDVGKQFTIMSAVAAVVGAAVGAVLGYVIGGDAGGALIGAGGGFIVGGILGFLYGGYTHLPTNEQLGDTYIGCGETSVAVHSDRPDEIDLALEALKGTDARRLATCGRDGELHDVA